MNKKINIQFLIVAFLAIIFTMAFSVGVFYKLLRTEGMDNLRTYTHILAATGVFDSTEEINYNGSNEDVRITIISEDGIVLYDNEADIVDMDNHGSRPEVEDAFVNGEGSDVRKSTTVKRDTFYYAVLLDNGYVLRVAKESSNMWSLLETALPAIMVITLILFVATMILAHFLTRSIVRPIEEMANNMDNIENVHAYKEMQPFINVIYKQHEEVVKNAKIREEFTANVSHELKTPLAAISGYSELIENGMAEKNDVQRFAKEIHHNSNRLLSLINDIIRLSELDVMDDDMHEDVDLYIVVQNAVDMMQINAKKHEVTLDMEGENCIVRGNKIMIEELVYNLTDNAIRYNNKGGSVHVSIKNTGSNVVLNVKDTGIGIPKEYQERVFERFYRVDKSRSKLTGGTGLGLAIVKHIVAIHNAEITMHSEEGVGTEVQVVFRLENE